MSIKVALSLVALFAYANSESYIDTPYDSVSPVKEDLLEAPELRQNNEQPNKNCLCKGPACVCCVDFNITFVDLGGPGCVHMKYLTPEEGFSVKVSYGKNLLHSSKIKGTNPAPVCLEVFGRFAQVCAKFSDLAPTSDGLRGCLELEPRLLGDSQLEFPIGCFKTSAGGMEMEDPPAEPEETTEENTTEEIDAVDFLWNIYQTAEQSVALIGSLFNQPLNKNTTTTAKPILDAPQEPEPQRRFPKNLKHPNQL